MDELTPKGKQLLENVLKKEEKPTEGPSTTIVEKKIQLTQNIENKADMIGHARMLSETMKRSGEEFCKSIESISDEMRKARLTHEYFSLIEQFSDCVEVLDEETVKQKCDEIMNMKMAKMSEREIMFLVSNFPSPEICKVIKQMTMQNGLSAYQNSRELISSAVISRIMVQVKKSDDSKWTVDFYEYELGLMVPNHKRGYKEINPLYCNFTSANTTIDRIMDLSSFGFYAMPNEVWNVESSEYSHIKNLVRVEQTIFQSEDGMKEKIQKEYIEHWKKNCSDINKNFHLAWQKAYCEWKAFEEELEAEYILKEFRKICFDMQMAASLARFNPK